MTPLLQRSVYEYSKYERLCVLLWDYSTCDAATSDEALATYDTLSAAVRPRILQTRALVDPALGTVALSLRHLL